MTLVTAFPGDVGFRFVFWDVRSRYLRMVCFTHWLGVTTSTAGQRKKFAESYQAKS